MQRKPYTRYSREFKLEAVRRAALRAIQDGAQQRGRALRLVPAMSLRREVDAGRDADCRHEAKTEEPLEGAQHR